MQFSQLKSNDIFTCIRWRMDSGRGEHRSSADCQWQPLLTAFFMLIIYQNSSSAPHRIMTFWFRITKRREKSPPYNIWNTVGNWNFSRRGIHSHCEDPQNVTGNLSLLAKRCPCGRKNAVCGKIFASFSSLFCKKLLTDEFLCAIIRHVKRQGRRRQREFVCGFLF